MSKLVLNTKIKKPNNCAIIKEAQNKTDVYSNQYHLSNGTSQMIVKSTPSNYYDKKMKKWQKIDEVFEEDDSKYTRKNGNLKIEIAKANNNEIKVANDNSNIRWHFLGEKNDLLSEKENGFIAYRPSNKFNQVNFKSASKKYELEYMLSKDRLKENIIVKEKMNSYEYLFELVTDNLKARLLNNKTVVEFYREVLKGNELEERVEFIIPCPYMVDADKMESMEVHYEISSLDNGKYLLAVVANADWINDERRKFPITIDPTFSTAIKDAITYQVQMRSITTTDFGEEYSAWSNLNSTVIRVSKTARFEYQTIITVNKDLIQKRTGHLTNATLSLTPTVTANTSLFIDGVLTPYNTATGDLKIEMTKRYREALDTASVVLSPYSTVALTFDTTENMPELLLEYIDDENIQYEKKLFNLAGVGVGELDLVTGNFITSINDIDGSFSAMNIPISHVYQRSSEDHLVGDNFHLNIEESLVQDSEASYVYTDSLGTQHLLQEYFYYFDHQNIKKYLEKTRISIGNDGSLQYVNGEQAYPVYVEYKSRSGLKAMIKLENITGIEYLEQREAEVKKLEEQVEAYRDVLNEYIVCDPNTLEIIEGANYELKNNLESNEEFEQFISKNDQTLSTLVMSKSAFNTFRSLQLQKDSLDVRINQVSDALTSTETENETSTETEDETPELINLKAQKALIEEQLVEFIAYQQPKMIEGLKKYYKEFALQKEELRKLKKQMPNSYLTDSNLFKGFNEDGQIVLIYDLYQNYAVFEYSDYLIDGQNIGRRISMIYDNQGNQVLFLYNANNMLSCIIDNQGNKVSYTYDDNMLKIISYDNGEEITLNQSNDNLVSIKSKKLSLLTEVAYAGAKILAITHYSTQDSFDLDLSIHFNRQIEQININYYESTTSPVPEVIISSETMREKFVFDERGFNTKYYIEEDGLVIQAEEYEYIPYWVEDESQLTPRYVQIKAKESTLYKEDLSSFVFEAGDMITTILNQFNLPEESQSSEIAISSSLVQLQNVKYYYDKNQQLVTKNTTITFKNGDEIVKEYTLVEKYNYNYEGKINSVESYFSGEENTTGINFEKIEYDEYGRINRTISYNTLDSSSKFYHEVEYDKKGRMLGQKNQLGNSKTMYNYIGKTDFVSEKILSNGSRYAFGYDTDGTLNAISQSTFEGEENTTSRIFKNGVIVKLNSSGNKVSYKYDYKRRILSVSLDGIDDYVVNTYAKDSTKETITTTYKNTGDSGNGNVVVSEYDLRGNLLTTKIDDNLQFDNTYNSKNQITVSTDKIKNNTSYCLYNNQNKLSTCIVQVNNATIYSEQFTRNNYNDLTSKVITASSVGKKHRYTYEYLNNAMRDLASITFKDEKVDSNPEIKFKLKRDPLKRNKGTEIYYDDVKISSEKISYLKQGDHATFLPSTIQFENTSDSLRYAYDNMGNIEKVYENGVLSIRYSYDALNRLVREDNKVLDKTVLIAYDNNGNIIRKREFSFTLDDILKVEEMDFTDYEYTYDKDRLISYNGKTITYDNLGRPLSYGEKNIVWEKVNQMVSYGDVQYTYDGYGRRCSKNNNEYFYDVESKLFRIGNAYEFIYDNKGIIGLLYNSVPYFYRKNAQNDVVALVDCSGNVVVKYVYDAWGNHKLFNSENIEIASDDATNIGNVNPIRYRGYYYDVETQLYWVSSRYYSPELCRWISPDSIEYLDPESINGLNLYAYCGNDPVNYYDPSGCFPVLACILGLTALVGMGLTIGGVASDNNLMTAIGLTMVAIPALISGGMAIASFGAWGIMAIGGVTAVAGVGTGLFASAEYQEAFTGNNWIIDTTGMSEEWYNGLMLATAAIATAGTVASMAGVTKYRNFGNSNWYNGWREMRHHYWKHGLKQMHMSNVYSYTNSAKAIIANGKYIGDAKNAYAIYVEGKKVLYVGISRANSLITTYSYRTYTIKKLIEFGLIVG